MDEESRPGVSVSVDYAYERKIGRGNAGNRRVEHVRVTRSDPDKR